MHSVWHLNNDSFNLHLDCFRQLKQRVIWKFENETLADLPPNVMIRKWLPQNDILAHKNVILFISHGGVFGMVESVWHGVPLLIMPFFGDQHRNAMRASRSGYGKYLPFFDITNQTLMSSIQELIEDESYLQRAKGVSSIFKTNLISPMEEAIFWIEYVCKFNGASHLKSNAANMSGFIYRSLDIMLAVLIFIVSLMIFIRLMFGWCCQRKNILAKEKTEWKLIVKIS